MPDYIKDNETLDNGQKTKTFTFWLTYNWKTGDVDLYTKKSYAEKKEGPYDIIEKVERKIKTPKEKQFKSEGEMEIDQAQMMDITAEEI